MTFATYWKTKLKEATWANYGSVPPIWIVKIGSKRTNTQYGVGILSYTQDYTNDHNSSVIFAKQFGEFQLYERAQVKLDALEDDLREIIRLSTDSTMLTTAEIIEDFDRPSQFQIIISAERLEV